ncbi:amidase [Tistlia consotensis]|uniref:Amidase n=1 Tax=Tistlia consotensis USBA 355 TaxID=560819 RepID=A0A1Y6B4Z2_9PROT|nr:amidase [Tistlia consotensis]SME89689.1 amidase [Tistlia consotensis USBA 355]SNR26207.1 amidase [Tistlia consotensis]
MSDVGQDRDALDHDPLGHDPLGAFIPGGRFEVGPDSIGPLSGLTFAAKDIFDVAGRVTGCGNPDWQRSHPPAERHAAAVAALLRAGATLVGKTMTDELAYSLNGQNFHYGTPANSNAPGRIPGGSSSGSASAVAGGLCDTALGSDTGGSIRIPSSYCGLYGLRPTHGRVDDAGVMPLAPSFDTVGWFARDAETLERVGAVLLGDDVEAAPFERLLLADDAWALAVPEARQALAPWRERLEQRLGKATAVTVGEPGGGLEAWMWRFRHIQAGEIQQVHGAWIEATQPRFGPEIAERFDWVKTVTAGQIAEAGAARGAFTARLRALVSPGTLMLLPSAPSIAPRLDADAESLRQHRSHVLSLTAISGLSGLPQVSLPLASLDGCPLGLSLIGPAGSDRALLTFAERFVATPA